MFKKCEEYFKIAGKVYQRYFKKYSYLKEDLIQEGVCSIFEEEVKYDSSRGSWSTFAFTTCRSAMLRIIRKENKKADDVSFDLISDFISDEEFDIYSMLDKISDIQDKGKVVKVAMTKFSNNQINSLFLYSNGFTQKEIASALNSSQQSISFGFKRVRKIANEVAKEMGVSL